MAGNMIYTWDFFRKEISFTSKMFYFMVPPCLHDEPETGVLIRPEIPDVELEVITLNSISSLISFSIKAKSNDSRFIFLHSRIIVVVKESEFFFMNFPLGQKTVHPSRTVRGTQN